MMPNQQRNPKFKQAVLAAGYIGAVEYDQVATAGGGNDIAVAEHLVREMKIPSDIIGKVWGDIFDFAYVNLAHTLIQPSIVLLIPEAVARKNQVFAIYEFAGAITVATPQPTIELARQLEKLLSRKIEVVFSLPSEIDAAIEVYYKSEKFIQELSRKLAILDVSDSGGKVNLDKLRAAGGNEAVVAFADGILLFGVRERASDIHIEPCEDFVRVRYRIDGRLQECFQLQRTIHPMLVSRLKILATCNIAERRAPQDGRINLQVGGRSIDYRFSTTPTIYGEKVVLRLLGHLKEEAIPEISSLLFTKQNYSTLLRLLKRPNGIFFVTGPTGSGKSMTLYSCLRHLNAPETNIMTIEDPVEYRLAGVNQIQVNHDIGFDFSKALRSFLRQDPDIILVGEIRDLETAKIACEAALTGHLVLATLHTNTAIQAFVRLIDMGVEPYMAAPTVIGAIGQRLVRRICDKCKTTRVLRRDELEERFLFEGNPEVAVAVGAGCPDCRGTGFRGRIAIQEIVEVNDEMRTLVGRAAPIMELSRVVEAAGTHSMYYDGLKKVLRGLTTFEEIDKAAGEA